MIRFFLIYNLELLSVLIVSISFLYCVLFEINLFEMTAFSQKCSIFSAKYDAPLTITTVWMVFVVNFCWHLKSSEKNRILKKIVFRKKNSCHFIISRHPRATSSDSFHAICLFRSPYKTLYGVSPV